MEKQEIEKLAEDNARKTYNPNVGTFDARVNAFIDGYLACQETNQWVKYTLPSEIIDGTKLLFQLIGGDIRYGSFLKKDQWGRANMFCDGAFHHDHQVIAYQIITPPKTSTNNLKT